MQNLSTKDIQTLSDLMREAYLCRESVDVYKQKKTESRNFVLCSDDWRGIFKMLDRYSAVRTVNKDDAVRRAFWDFVTSKRDEFEKFADTFTVNADTLMKTGFGAHKLENLVVSAISKCAYFMTEYKFPIYDRQAKNTLNILSTRLGVNVDCTDSYVAYFQMYGTLLQSVRQISTDPNRNLIDEMDAFLWMYGMTHDSQASGFKTKKWGDLSCAASWYNKVRNWLAE